MKRLTNLVIWLLNKTDFPLEDRNALKNAILEKVNGLPIVDIIDYDKTNQRITIGGKLLATDEKVALTEGATALRNNFTRKVIINQKMFEAVKIALYAKTLDQQLFGQVAVWLIKKEEELLENLENGIKVDRNIDENA